MIQELRIGNWVIYEGSITPLQIDAYSFARATDLLERYEPIPINNQVLEKAGFVNGKLEMGFQILEVKNDEASIYDPHIHSSHTDFPCKYIHQLQNLYFALTGEELNIQL